MPLSQPSGHCPPDSGLDQILRRGDRSSDKSIQETILEPGQKGRGKAALGEKSMGPGFSFKTSLLSTRRARQEKQEQAHWAGLRHTFTVNQNLRVVTIRTHQHGFAVDLLVGQAGLAVDDFQQLRGD